MPYDITDLAPQVELLARHYALEVAPGRQEQARQGVELLQRTTQADLQQAAAAAMLYIQAWPVEAPMLVAPSEMELPEYLVVASDGSSIEPEDPVPMPHCLIHAAVAGFAYRPPAYWVAHAVDFRYTAAQMHLANTADEEPLAVAGPVIATLRAFAELEFLHACLPRAQEQQQNRPLVALMDAVMLWSHRGVGEAHEALKKEYLARSAQLVVAFGQANVPLVSFISGPNHREVIHSLMACFCRYPGSTHGCGHCPEPASECLSLRELQDQHLFSFLQVGERSAVFRSVYRGNMRWRLASLDHAPDPQLAFCYMRTGSEIVRLEFPLSVYDGGRLAEVQGIVLDQCRPPRCEQLGYPVALTMAHREAALTTADRTTLQWLIEAALARYGVTVAPRAKTQMKGG